MHAISFYWNYLRLVFGNIYGLLLAFTGGLELIERFIDKQAHVPVWVGVAAFVFIALLAQTVAYKQLNDNSVPKTESVSKAEFKAMEQRAQNAESLKNNLDSENASLKQKLSGRQVPADLQLENDAYRLAEEIDKWFSEVNPQAAAAERSQTASVFNNADFIRFSNPPSGFDPGDPDRVMKWTRSIQDVYRTSFQQRTLVLEQSFKSHGINPPGNLAFLEDTNGPLGIRQTIKALRQSANDLVIQANRQAFPLN